MYKFKGTKYQMFLNILSILVLIGTTVYLIISWNSIPQKIPGHYNGSGIIDRWGNKSEVWIILVIGIIMYLGLSIVEYHPRIWNSSIEVNGMYHKQIYSLVRGLLVNEKFILTVNFAYLTVNSSLCLNLSSWYTLVFISLTLGIIVIYIIRFILLNRKIKENRIYFNDI